jgi:hypothetical protein
MPFDGREELMAKNDDERPIYTHEQLDYPDPPYDPDPMRLYRPPQRAKERAWIAEKRALLRLWVWMSNR